MCHRAPTQRFSDRVADYVAARPGYPPQIVENLREAGALPQGAIVADIGSGTGISTALFLEAGCQTFAVEPNDAMRAAAEGRFADNPLFVSVRGTAEETTLPDHSVDVVAAGQAFHWFKPAECASEFARILRPGGWITIFWNTRDHKGSSLMAELEALIRRFGTDYTEVTHERLHESALAAILRRDRRHFRMGNQQVLDRGGLHARLLSASYLPQRGTPAARQMLDAADALFEQHQRDGRITLLYRTDQYLGRP